MSIALIAAEIQRFLSTDEPEVLSISGDWDVGKTFAWNRYLQEAKTRKNIELKRYAYVSLFGVNSLDELKYSIFESSVHTTEIGVEPDLKTALPTLQCVNSSGQTYKHRPRNWKNQAFFEPLTG